MLQESAVKDTSEVYVKAAREAISMAEEKEGTIVADDVRLAELGYKSEFRREFSVSCFCDFAKMRKMNLTFADDRDYSVLVFDHGSDPRHCFHIVHLAPRR